MTDRQEPLTPDMWGDLEAEARVPGPTMTITKGQYAAMRTAIERAARQEAADTSGLRVALHADPAVCNGKPHARWKMLSKCDHIAARLRAALSQEPTPDERPLDVERLARTPIFQRIVDDTGTLESYEEVAGLVAAEYARLSAAGKDRS